MAAYSHSVAPAPRAGTDVATWALVALVVALIAGAGGWAIGHVATPTRSEAQIASQTAYQTAHQRGLELGRKTGARYGRKEAKLKRQQMVAKQGQVAYTKGYQSGVKAGKHQRNITNPYSNTVSSLDTGYGGYYASAPYYNAGYSTAYGGAGDLGTAYAVGSELESLANFGY
jgi:hypothetical protein